DRADRNDELVRVTVRLTHGQRQETVARLAGETLEREPLPVGELHLNMRPLGGVSRGVALDLTVDTVDESVEGRLRCPRDPEIGAQKSFVSFPPALNRSRPSSVMMRPRGVRCRNPSCRRYGSYTSSIVSCSSPRATASVDSPTGPPPNLTRMVCINSRSMRSSPSPSTSSSSRASR